MRLVHKFPVACFLVAALLVSYVLGIGFYLASEKAQELAGIEIPGVGEFILKFGPSLAGLLIAWRLAGRIGVRDLLARLLRWRAPAWIWVLAIFLPPATFALALLSRNHASALGSLDALAALGVFLTQLAFNALLGGGLGEEIGWRGFLLPRLCERYSPLVASLFVAMAWFAWHIPGYLLTDKADADPILPFAAIVFPFSIILTWLYYRTGESLLFPVLLHASINASFYSMTELLPQVTRSPAFQPAYDWVLAVIWCVAGFAVLGRYGPQLGKAAESPGKGQ
ncbi:MAG: type II CAAX endopeptidase family protein [Pseudoxanthomonas sp.]